MSLAFSSSLAPAAPASPGSLRLMGTFIDIHSPSSDEATRSCKSAPASPTFRKGPWHFQEEAEEAYLQGLSQKVWESPNAVIEHLPAAPAKAPEAKKPSPVTLILCDFGCGLPASDNESNGAIDSEGVGLRWADMTEEEDATYASQLTHGAFGTAFAFGIANFTNAASEAALPPPPAPAAAVCQRLDSPSLGSAGHAVGLCQATCHQFATGDCPDGEACRFCHHVHEKASGWRLDKANRSAIAGMEHAARVEIFFAIMQEKVPSMGLGPSSSDLVQEWRREVLGGSPTAEQLPRKVTRHVSGALRLMPFNVLCRMAINYLGGGEVEEATFRLLDSLRKLL